MSFCPCIVLPVYNPGPGLERTLQALRPCALPLFITDDGSDAETQRVLEAHVAANPLIRLSRLPENQGKGVAVMEAFRRAHAGGFSHALQVDADGQHDAAAIPQFLDLGAARPEAVVAGVPDYQGPVPAMRRYCRYFTHVWVWIETLSFDIGDSLCGFRLYPLDSTLRVMERANIPARMDFDSEMIVRLHWAGVPVVNAKVRVVYPEDGVSHFHLVQDNWRITKMHTRLFFGMLPRAPRLLLRKRSGDTQRHWSRIAERGTALGLWTVLWTYRLLGRRGVRLLTEVLAFYFFLTGRRARKASKLYLTRCHDFFGPTPALPGPPRRRDLYKHFRAFASSAADRFLAWIDRAKGLEPDFPDRSLFETLNQSGQGALFISAHLGNLDVLRALGASTGVPGLNAVVYSEHAARFRELLKSINPDFISNLIHVSSVGPETAILLQEKIQQGEHLFIVGDRTPASENGRVTLVPFLGVEAAFPIGPFLLAHLLECPVYLFFCYREAGRYRIRMERFADRIRLPRQDRAAALQEWAARFAKVLEECCRKTPFEWFNFYDFWRSEKTANP